jgi:hypothetical protein
MRPLLSRRTGRRPIDTASELFFDPRARAVAQAGGNTQSIATTVLGGAVILIVWEALVALVARRRPVPLILYVIGLLAAGAGAANLIVSTHATTQTAMAESAAIGVIAAIGFLIIWRAIPAGAGGGGTRTAVSIVRPLVTRAIAFTAIVLALSLILRLVRGG